MVILKFQIRGMLFDNRFEMSLEVEANSNIAKLALSQTKFAPVLRLCTSHTSFAYCKTTEVGKLLKLIKKMPQFILLGLIMEDRLLHRADIEKIAKMPDITSVRAQLCQTLQLGSASLSKTLLANQMALSTSLSTFS